MKRLSLAALMLVSFAVGTGYAKTVDTCFSPAGHCDQVLVSWIDASRISLEGSIYGLTDTSIAEALIRAKQRGVQVRLVHDQSQSAGSHDVSDELIRAGVPLHIQRGSAGGILHDKFLVIDGKYVITGSFNWTKNAKAKNDENFVVLDDQAPKFHEEFERLWALPPTPPGARTTHRTRRYYHHTSKSIVLPLPGHTAAPHHRHWNHHRRKPKPVETTTLPPVEHLPEPAIP
jgi:phosphatidylserine/phosphatidylglycerophosphate/cardiolipin synthase-like enzyme